LIIFAIQNGLKQGDALSPLLFNFALEYAITKVQVNQVGLKLNGAHQLLSYADDVNVLGNNIDIVKKNTGKLIYASKVVGLEIYVDKDKNILLLRMAIRWAETFCDKSINKNVLNIRCEGRFYSQSLTICFCLL
jgi:hypothetical protein